jgi:hypothetical protein
MKMLLKRRALVVSRKSLIRFFVENIFILKNPYRYVQEATFKYTVKIAWLAKTSST